VDDLQFAVEETAIDKGDLEVTSFFQQFIEHCLFFTCIGTVIGCITYFSFLA